MSKYLNNFDKHELIIWLPAIYDKFRVSLSNLIVSWTCIPRKMMMGDCLTSLTNACLEAPVFLEYYIIIQIPYLVFLRIMMCLHTKYQSGVLWNLITQFHPPPKHLFWSLKFGFLVIYLLVGSTLFLSKLLEITCYLSENPLLANAISWNSTKIIDKTTSVLSPKHDVGIPSNSWTDTPLY